MKLQQGRDIANTVLNLMQGRLAAPYSLGIFPGCSLLEVTLVSQLLFCCTVIAEMSEMPALYASRI